ncbi:MAG: hypothetical protein JWP87_4083 [Labilithrix sp.]|nr:hypothetical protein [Labilithrix sp.]
MRRGEAIRTPGQTAPIAPFFARSLPEVSVMHVIRKLVSQTALFVALLSAVMGTGCASRHYVYAPARTTSADIEPLDADLAIATYAIPTEAPRGDVRVGALGLEGGALHVALVVTNRSDVPWTVNIDEQEIELDARYGRVEEPATPPDGDAPHVVAIAPGGGARIDLFFVVPADFDDEKHLAAFDVIWTVHAGDQPVMQRTAFERYRVKLPRAAVPRLDDPSERRGPFPERDVSPGPGSLPGPGQWPPPRPVY